MCVPHPWGVLGLGANTLGALLLLWYAPPPAMYTKSGLLLTGVPDHMPTEEELQDGRRRLRRSKVLYRLAILLMVIGFPLQLLDLLTG